MKGLLSPAPSPPETVQENMSRKRTRSASHSSADSPSSPKRAASEVPSASSDIEINHASSQRANSLVRLTDDLGIDQYMVLQDQAMDTDISTQCLSSQEKLTIIRTLKQKEMTEGETWFVISHSWYKKWEQACSGKIEKNSTQLVESSMIPVDNSDIADSQGNITVSPAEGLSVDYVPEQAWEHFVQWYGKPERPLPRTVILHGLLREPRLELFPLFLHASVLVPLLSAQFKPTPRNVTLSKTATISKLIEELNRVNKLTIETYKTRYWLVQGSNSETKEIQWYTASRLLQERGKLLDTSKPEKTLEESLIETGDVFVFERQINNEWQINETPQVSRSVTPLFGSASGQDFFSKLGSSSSRASSDLLAPKSSGYGVNRTASPSKPAGLIGLVNLGNTCFMASALQCLKADPDLAEYFLTGAFRDELNLDNPLGMHGAVAESFGALLARLWVQNPSSSSYSPREFKQTIARFAPSFSGYQEQDSQEFLAFLLDGLHEDLNRIIKKPYIEKPEWEGGGPHELMDLADKSWKGYMMRNDSVIVDLFQGQYKSTLICPECSKVSITFDPFMYLTLPLPITKKWNHTIYYVPWDTQKSHIQIPLELPHGSSFKALKRLLGRWMGVSPENLLTLEVWSGRFYKNLTDDLSVQEITARDTVVCFELPCNAQQGSSFQRAPEDPFILPVFHSLQNATSSRPVYGSYRSNTIFGNPFVVVVDSKQTGSIEGINEAVVERLSRWTTQDLYTWEGSSVSNSEDHIVPLDNSVDTITEIRESGEVVTIEESDITEMSNDEIQEIKEEKSSPKRLGPKSDIFTLRLHAPSSRYNFSDGCDKNEPSENPITWKSRALDSRHQTDSSSETPVSLIKPGDWLVCEWDVHMQAFYFGTEQNNYENSRWRQFPEFLHPEYTASVRAREEQKKNLTIEDCLDEFTREEQLGEDDPWYCPRCKKHQQATKKFEIWKVPEVLVVHLKRFSSSRILRDKIDLLVDFPVEGLDLGHRVSERQFAISMKEDGLDLPVTVNPDEPLVYDLFGVTEHHGSLGGGHYRAYAKNHVDNNWYLFNDTHVSRTTAQAAVNEGAYLLFYKRRGSANLVNKTREKVRLARQRATTVEDPVEESRNPSNQLPTPPGDSSPPAIPPRQPKPLPLLSDDKFSPSSTTHVPAAVDDVNKFVELFDSFRESSPTSSNGAFAGSSSDQSDPASPFSSTFTPPPTDPSSTSILETECGNDEHSSETNLH